jgi:excisionase family DNA binding protein
MIDPTTFMSAQEVANRLGAGINFVYALIRDGKLEAFQIGKGYRISEEAFQRYLESTRVEVK